MGTRIPPRVGTTTAQNAEAAAKANAAPTKEQLAEARAGATFAETKKNPAQLRSTSHDFTDPDTLIRLPVGQIVEVPHVGGWLRSQINANLIEVVAGDEGAPTDDIQGPLPGSHAWHQEQLRKQSGQGAVNQSTGEADPEPVKADGETDEHFAERKADWDARHPA